MQIKVWEWRRRLASAVVGGVLLAGSVQVLSQEKPYPEIDQQLKQLKAQFNADVGKVRVLVIGDPTCPPCRRGGFGEPKSRLLSGTFVA